MTTSGQQVEQAAQSGDMEAAHRRLLADPRFELMPFDSIEEQVTHLPDDATITITASPSLGLEATISWSETLAQQGYEVVPHVAARYVRDEDHLAEISERLVDVGVTDIFVPGGDREDPIGEFESAYQLLTALADLEYEFDEVGITGYPEGHEFLEGVRPSTIGAREVRDGGVIGLQAVPVSPGNHVIAHGGMPLVQALHQRRPRGRAQ